MTARKTSKRIYARSKRASKPTKKLSPKKRLKKLSPKKRAYSKEVKALAKKERELQLALEELRLKRRLYRKGYGKKEATRQVKKFFKEQLEAAKRHGDTMEKALRRSAADLEDFAPTVRVHVNSDSTVDGELVLIPPPDDADIREHFREIVSALPKMRGAWLLPEVYYTPELEDFYDESDFLVRQGLVGVQVHSGLSSPTASQWMKPSGLTKTVTMRLLTEKFEDEVQMKPAQYVLRLFWSRDGRRP